MKKKTEFVLCCVCAYRISSYKKLKKKKLKISIHSLNNFGYLSTSFFQLYIVRICVWKTHLAHSALFF